MSDFMAELLKTAGKDDPGKVNAKPVVARVESKIETTRFVDGERVKEEKEIKSERKEVDTKFVSAKTMYMSVDMGGTINLGNFNMGKVSVSLSMPVGMEVTPEVVRRLDDSYAFAKKWVEVKMEQEVKELLRLRA